MKTTNAMRLALITIVLLAPFMGAQVLTTIQPVIVNSLPADPIGAAADPIATAGGTGTIPSQLRLLGSLTNSLNTSVTTMNTNVATLAGAIASARMKMAYGDGTSVGPTDVADVNLKNCQGSACSGTNGLFVTEVPSTTAGWDSFNATAADGATACTNSGQTVKASAGTFGGFYVNNPNTADSWLHVYNSASVTVGTTNPKLTFRVPGAATNSGGATIEIARGVVFSTAMIIACTSTAATNAAPSTALDVDIFFK